MSKNSNEAYSSHCALPKAHGSGCRDVGVAVIGAGTDTGPSRVGAADLGFQPSHLVVWRVAYRRGTGSGRRMRRVEPERAVPGLDQWSGMWGAVKDGKVVAAAYNSSAGTGICTRVSAGVLPNTMQVCTVPHHAAYVVDQGVADGASDLDLPHRLVYLLDYEYTERGLSWNRLKGADAERAALLRAAADQAGCEAVLALAEVKETWDCYPSEDQWDDYDDDDEDDCGDDPDPDGYEFTDLIDSDISLGWWTSPSGKGGESVSLDVPDSEVCATTPSVELKPYQSEYEGYMRNYGNTMDRWYRRDAVVVWPLERAFAARAEASAPWALPHGRARAHAGDLKG